MNKRIILLMLLTSAATLSFINTKQKGFKIIGSVIGMPDSTRLFLCDITTGSFVTIDSTILLGGKFFFEGMLHAKAMNAAIRTKDFSDYGYLWVENADITFDAAKGKFKEAVISGSETQDEHHRLMSAVQNAGNEKLLDIRFIQDHPESVISAYLLSVYTTTWGRDTAAMLYRNLSRDNKNSYYGKNINDFITLNKNPKPGEQFVDFTQADITGNNLQLSSLKGKVILLDFWASWCGPCRKENPELVKTYNKYKDKGFEIFGVSADADKASWLDAVRADSLPWKNVSDLNGDKNKAVLIYGISHFPDNFLIDKNGIIIGRDIRGEALRNKLKEIFE